MVFAIVSSIDDNRKEKTPSAVEKPRDATYYLFVRTVGDADDVEYRLIRDLLRNYDHRIRPSLNASEPLNVTFGLALAQIIDVVRYVTAELLRVF